MKLLSGPLLLAAALSFSVVVPSPPALAEDRPLVGVLRPTFITGPSKAFQGMPPEILAKAPKKYRQQLEASAQSMAASRRQMQERIAAQVPELIQRTWIEMLADKGISAAGIASPSAGSEATEKASAGIGWFLRSEVETHVSQVGPAVAPPLGGRSAPQIRRTLSVRFSLTDKAGGTVLPTRGCSAEDVSAAQDKALGSGKDLWAECGDAIVAAVSSALPLGTVKYMDPALRLPKAPNMAESIRLDISINAKSSYKGKALDAFEKPESFILELAGGAVATQDRKSKTGTIVFPDDPRVFVVDDDHRTYYILLPADLETVAPQSGPIDTQGEQAVRLKRAGTDGPSIRYTLERGISALLPSSQPTSAGSETTVLIDYGGARVAWQKGLQQLLSRPSAIGIFPIQLARSDVPMNMALWNELAAQVGPPRLIRIVNAQSAAPRYKISQSTTETEITFTTTELPKVVDFTLPSGYRRQSNPYLQLAFIP